MTDLTTDKPWERRDGEPDGSYTLLRMFLHMGSSRSLKALADGSGIPESQLSAMATENDWTARADAFDLQCAALDPAMQYADPNDIRTRHMTIGKLLLDFGLTAMQYRDPGKVPLKLALTIIKEGADLQRRALGDAAVTVQISGPDARKVDELLAETIAAEAIDVEEVDG